jgi:hypothetical protein
MNVNKTKRPRTTVTLHPGFWMRSVQFAGLHRILHRVAKFRDGIRVTDLNQLIAEERDYWTERGVPSKTTLYHCRNTLLQLGALERVGQKLILAWLNPTVMALVGEPPVRVKGHILPPPVRDGFATLVLANQDCYNNFFRLFLPNLPKPTLDDFRNHAGSVVWRTVNDTKIDRRERPDGGKRGPGRDSPPCELRSEMTGERITLAAEIQLRSILYGVRDWACKQLRMTDEFFDVRRNGSVIFPLRHNDCDEGNAATVNTILEAQHDGSEWTTVPIRDLLTTICERDGHSVDSLFRGIRHFVRSNPGYVSLIPTIPNFMTITATSRKSADFQLRSALADSRGRFISHIRFYNAIREHRNGKEKTKC